LKDRLLSVLKFILAVLLLPLVIGITSSFLENLRKMSEGVCLAFGWGVVVYLILHILLYEPAQVFDASKKMAEKTIGFLSPWVKVAGFCVPFFTILSFVLYYFASLIWKDAPLFPYFAFLASFTFTMHMVFTANALKKKQPGWLKENYFFSIFSIYIVNILIIAGAFYFLSGDFSFADFISRCGDVAGAIYTASFRQLFVVEGR
jgi:hypothetical protein